MVVAMPAMVWMRVQGQGRRLILQTSALVSKPPPLPLCTFPPPPFLSERLTSARSWHRPHPCRTTPPQGSHPLQPSPRQSPRPARTRLRPGPFGCPAPRPRPLLAGSVSRLPTQRTLPLGLSTPPNGPPALSLPADRTASSPPHHHLPNASSPHASPPRPPAGPPTSTLPAATSQLAPGATPLLTATTPASPIHQHHALHQTGRSSSLRLAPSPRAAPSSQTKALRPHISASIPTRRRSSWPPPCTTQAAASLTRPGRRSFSGVGGSGTATKLQGDTG